MSRIIKTFLLMGIIALLTILSPEKTKAADAEDYFETISMDGPFDGSLRWDSVCGPAYQINPETGELISCSSVGGKIINFSRKGNVVTVTVWSAELPKNTTYVIDMDKMTKPGYVFETSTDGTDTLDEVSMVYDSTLYWDTKLGPGYRINPRTGELIGCGDSSGKIVSFSRNGKVITVTVWSNELPKNTTYIIDIDKMLDPNYNFLANVKDEIVSVEVNLETHSMGFTTEREYSRWIDLNTGKLMHLEEGAKDEVTYFNKKGNIITMTIKNGIGQGQITYVVDISEYVEAYYKEYYSLYGYDFELQNNSLWLHITNSDSIFVELTTGKITSDKVTISGYEFTGSKVKLNVTYKKTGATISYELDVSEQLNALLKQKDSIEYYYIFEGDMVAFDTELGPYYLFNYGTGELIETDSVKPGDIKVVGYSLNGNNLEITVRSFERPKDEKYTFDISKNKTIRGIGDGITDIVEFYSFFDNGKILEFDSEQGPYYKIDVENGKIISCSCNESKIVSIETVDNKVTITLFSEEFSYNVTYVFNRQTNKVSCDIEKIEDTVYEEQFNAIIDKVVSGDISETVVDSVTAEKIKEAKNNNKKITTSVESNVVIPENVETATVNLVNKKIKEAGLSASQYMDINISIYAEGEKLGNINELEMPIEFTINVDFNLNETGKIYYVLRIHNGQVDVLETKIVGDNTLSFETDRFSTYVLTYKDEQAENDSVNVEETESATDSSNIIDSTGGDSGFRLWWVLVPAGAILITIGVLTIIRKIKK